MRIHFAKSHKTSPVVYCICGAPITSKTVLYKHVSDHKLESKKKKRKVSNENEDNDNDDDDNGKYTNLNINDFVKYV